MEINSTVREARILVESSIEGTRALQDKLTGTKLTFGFQITVAPGPISSSEVLSYLDKLVGAIKKFPEDQRMKLSLEFPLVHPEQLAHLTEIKERFEKVVSLEQPKKLVGVPAPGDLPEVAS